MTAANNWNLARERILLGAAGGAKIVKLQGENAAITTSAETVWIPSTAYTQLTAAVAMEAISGSANDAAAGTGARTIEADLVNGNGVETTVTITLNGTNAVPITGTYLAVNRLRILTAGSGLTNAGAVSIRTVSGSVVQSQIAAGAGIAGTFMYTVPANHTAIMSSILFSAHGVTGTLNVDLWVKNSVAVGYNVGKARVGISATSINPGSGLIALGSGLVVEQRHLIELRATVGAGAGVIAAHGEALVVNNDSLYLVGL